MGTGVIELPSVAYETTSERDAPPDQGLPWQVILHNDDHHTVQEVVQQVQKATGCSAHRAFEITMEVHTRGQSVCFTGGLSECERVAGILREIGLTVTLDHVDGL